MAFKRGESRHAACKRVAASVAFGLAMAVGLGLHGSVEAQQQPGKVSKAAPAQKPRATHASRPVKATAPALRAGSAVSSAAPKAAPRPQAKAAPARPSMGQVYGLHGTPDPLDLKSSVALVVDPHTDEVLFAKNSNAVLPIASITKVMTSMLVLEAQQDLDEVLSITQDDVDTEKGSGSRLAVGTRLTRRDALHLALMASENRAANALGRHYPGGLDHFVEKMNQRARELGMADTRFVEPTGLSSRNQSSAHDLAVMVKAAHTHELLREYSTSRQALVQVGKRQVQFQNTNGLIRGGTWDIAMQKTGYISEAGRCLVMQATLAGRDVIMVLLDSAGRYSRIGDAERIRKWMSRLPQGGDRATL